MQTTSYLPISLLQEKQILSASPRQIWTKETEKLGTDTHYFPSFAQIEAFLKENCRPGDLLITMGAGDVVTIGENLLKQTS